MRFITVLGVILAFFVSAVDAAPTGRRPVSATNAAGASLSDSGKSATSARVATRNSARSAAPSAPTAARSAVSARSGVQPVKNQAVAARAGTTQKVINNTTKVSTASKNIVVSEECQTKYEGCMDSFCMLDNTTGGRCICSNKGKEFDSILAEIEKLDQQSYQMATLGVSQIEMGAKADQVIANANAAAEDAINGRTDKKIKNRRKLDTSAWDIATDDDESEDLFTDFMAPKGPLDGKTGDALHRAAADLCSARMPECAADMDMLQMMYAQKIRSDCNAYENSLKQQKIASSQKLQSAQTALREAALDQLEKSNKYDLGQCTIQFKNCMIETAGCGADFSNCATTAASDNTNVVKSTSKKAKGHFIKGATTTIEISASTYDTLDAKKPLCMSVTESCVNVKDQVWDTFLKEVAPQLKSAELIAEDKIRQDCIGNISSCFQQACKDNMDPNDPDGSYDMCLSRPETMLSLCKVPLEKCGIQTTGDNGVADIEAAQNSQIWNFVAARLASIRVDSCTKEVKNCLTSQDRCGKDYTNCIGLDTDTIIRMCPYQKLTGCVELYGQDKMEDEAVYENVYSMVQGIFLNIDNNFLDACIKAVSAKVLEVCGTETNAEGGCSAFTNDEFLGTESLVSYTDSNGDYVIDGLMSFGDMKIVEVQKTSGDTNKKFGSYQVDIESYLKGLPTVASVATKDRIENTLRSLASKIDQKVAILTEDPTIHMCLFGRDKGQLVRKQEVKNDKGEVTARMLSTEKDVGRFPNLLDSVILSFVSTALDTARTNYNKKYSEMVANGVKKQDDTIKAAMCASLAANSGDSKVCTSVDEKTGECTGYSISNPFDNLFKTENVGLSEDNTKYVISVGKMKDIAAIQSSGHSEHILTDDRGNMLGRIAMAATYSAPNSACTLTTTTTACKNAEKIITKSTQNVKQMDGLDMQIFGPVLKITLGHKKRKSVYAEQYHGTVCTQYAEPVITNETVSM